MKMFGNIYIISASLSMATANADEMGGLYIGLGANVGYDEYDARANVGQSGAYGVTVQNTVDSATLQNGDYANILVTKLWECGKTGEPQDITYKDDDDDDPEVTIVSSKDMENYEEVNVYYGQDIGSGSYYCTSSTYIYAPISSNEYIPVDDFSKIKSDSSGDLHIHENGTCQYKIDGNGVLVNITGEEEKKKYYYRLHPDGGQYDNYEVLWNDEKQEYTYTAAPRVQLAKLNGVITKSTITSDKATYLMSQSLHRSGHNAGGEMKMAYFHDFGNHIMAGLDLTGSVLSKNRRDIQVSKFNVNDVYPPELTLKSNDTEIATAKYTNGAYNTTMDGTKQIAANSTLTLSADLDSFKSAAMQANPGMQVKTDPINGTYIDVSNNDKEVSFEKGIFNPKLAFVVGGTYKGWFAGLRAGVSYNTGKVKTQEMTETKSVSIASPLVGVQVMKKVSDNTNLYMTADWNVGDLRKSVDINGIKSFKQSSYNISAGVQWKCNFLK